MTERQTSELHLLTPFDHRGIAYSNRVVFSPLTRSSGVPGALQAEYYRQRASAGLLISEAIAIVPEGRGGAWTPGIYNDEQIDGWRMTTDAVHGVGGRIFAQLWHAGRLGHSSFDLQGRAPASPVAAAAEGQSFTEQGMVPYETPRALTVEEVDALIATYGDAADNAMRAGFDGVEIHGAHGYLLDSFLRDAINDRSDIYGGSLENRARFLVSVLTEVAARIGADRVAVRLSPNTRAGGMSDRDSAGTFGYVIDRMNDLDIAFLDLVEGDNLVSRAVADGTDTDAMAARFKGAVILNHGYTRETAEQALSSGRADMIAFGRAFIANPDLVERLRDDLPIVDARRSTYYGGGAEGLIDFPSYSAGDAAASEAVAR